ncbi:MAG: M20 family metallopeptidase [Chloroflexota bacterium]|jgi:amidohydrolase
MDGTALKRRVAHEIDALSAELREISLEIYSHPEVGYEERKAAALLSDRLELGGFSVERGVAGLETAFVGKHHGRAEGPKIAILAEYDALPGLGHACGHNLIATAALGAALGLGVIMDSIDGTLFVVGSPAEEKVGGKITLVESGLFAGIDAALMLHPRGDTQLGRLFTATTNMEMVFHGKSSHAAAAPDKGVNALDACIATFNGTNALKKHLRDDVRLHGVILDGGTAANIVPERTKAVFSIRARDRIYLQSVIDKVRACAEAGAMMAGCTVEISTEAICAEMNFNRALSDAFGRNASSLGHEVLPLDMNVGGGSTDMGSVSQVVPSIHPFLKIGDSSLTPHTREFLLAAQTEAAHQYTLDGAKMLAMTAIDVWSDPELLRQAKKEFEVSTRIS